MKISEIDDLRILVKRLKNIYWHDGSGGMKRVTEVPKDMKDPDETGVRDFIARLDDGKHIDLSDVDLNDFVMVSVTKIL